MKIVIDPGHAGRNVDPGAVHPGTGLQEADVALAVSRFLEAAIDTEFCSFGDSARGEVMGSWDGCEDSVLMGLQKKTAETKRKLA